MMSISSVLEGEIEAVGGARALGRAAVVAPVIEGEARALGGPVEAADTDFAAKKKNEGPAERLARQATLSRHQTLILHEDCASRTTEGGRRRHLCPRPS